MTDTADGSALHERALCAWRYMIQPVDPMPAYAAINFIMDEIGCEGPEAKTALYRAAAASIPAGPNYLWEFTSNAVIRYVADSRLDLAADGVKAIRRSFGYPDASYRPFAEWGPWCDLADRVIDLCNQIRGA